jgi:hypothetical protein
MKAFWVEKQRITSADSNASNYNLLKILRVSRRRKLAASRRAAAKGDQFL